MKREYLKQNVYEALLDRLHFISEEPKDICVSFSGGKDSGLLLNLVLDYRSKYALDRRIGVFHQGFEAQYTVTTEYIERTLERIKNEARLHWVCSPMATGTVLSNYEIYQYPWDDTKQELWVRDMSDKEYVINLSNNPTTTYRYRIHQEDLAKQFGRWYRKKHGDKKTIGLPGIHADESLQRYSGFLNRKYGYKGKCWISKQFKDVWYAFPLYDWSVRDVRHANYLSPYDYNSLYDLYYKAGLTVSQMRVVSPFDDYSKDAIDLHWMIDPEIWCRLARRAQGANLSVTYRRTKAMGYRSITLPPGHTQKSYTQFLLDTLPKQFRNNYIRKLNTSIRFWHETGGGLDENVIQELEQNGYRIRRNDVSNYTLNKKSRTIFLRSTPDNMDNIRSTKDIPSWKRMCYCTLKNDYTCRFMGFGMTRQQWDRLKLIKKKHESIEDFNYESSKSCI